MEVNGFSDYLIYNDGRVWSKRRNKFMKEFKNERGYIQVVLSKGKKYVFRVHRLIAEHYIPNPENKPQVDHINRNRSDNRIDNLRWASIQEQNDNRGTWINNKSNHKYISWNKSKKSWRFQVQGKYKANRYFKSKTDAICYKFIYLLKIKRNNLPTHHSSLPY